MAVVTPEQRASKDPIMKEWVAAKDRENGTVNKTMVGPILGPESSRPTVNVPVTTTPTNTTTIDPASGLPKTNTPHPSNGTLSGPYIVTNPDGTKTTQAGMNVVNGQMQPNQQAAATTGQTGASGALNSAQSYIDMLTEAKKKQSYAALEKAKNNALSGLSNEKSAIAPNYTNQRNQTAAGSQQNARNFAEYMASRGSTSAGSGMQAELTRQMSLQGNLGSLGRQENAAYDDIARRTTDVNNNYESDKVAADASSAAERIQLLMNDYYSSQARGDTLAQNEILNKIQEAQLNLQKSAQEYNQSATNPNNVSANLNNQLTQLQIKDYPAQSQAAAQKVQQDLATGKLNQQVAEFQLKELKDPNSPANLTAALDLKLKQLEVANLPEQQKLQIQQLRKSIDQIGKAPYQSANDKAMDELKLKTANLQYDELLKASKLPKPGPAPKTAADYYSQLDSSIYLVPEQIPGGPGQPPIKTGKMVVSDPDKFEAYIYSLPDLSNPEKIVLLKRYGIYK